MVDGKGTIQAEGQQMIVDQQSHKLITNWESFNVGAQEGVTLRQPDQNAIALNRVIGNEGSSILGRIDANGQVFLVNPNGVLFGQGNVGSLVASTLDIGNEDFGGSLRVQRRLGCARRQRGRDHSRHGRRRGVAGSASQQHGHDPGPEGHVGLAAGSSVLLRFDNGSPVFLQVDRGATDALAHNSGLIQAASGNAQLSANATNTAPAHRGQQRRHHRSHDPEGRQDRHDLPAGRRPWGPGVRRAGRQRRKAFVSRRHDYDRRPQLSIAPTLKVSTLGAANQETGLLTLTSAHARPAQTTATSDNTVLSSAQLVGMLEQNE